MNTTPGPWSKTEDKLTEQYIIARPYGKTIYRIAYVTKKDVGHGISEEEYHANANLIATAPELLEACIEAIHILSEFDKNETGEDKQHRINQAIYVLRNAVKEAKHNSLSWGGLK